MRGELLKSRNAGRGRQAVPYPVPSFRYHRPRPDLGGDVQTRRCGSVREAAARPRGSSAAASRVVRSSDGPTNRLTVELGDGSTVAYDPKRVYGVNVFRETSREFATGDRLQFSALNKELGISNRDMGTITKMEPDRLTVLMDGKEQRSVSFDPKEFRQYDHGYAVTSHSAQGLTTGRVIANIDTDSSRSLINTRLAYVAISRASEDARIYTNNAETLGQRLATDVTKTVAARLYGQGKNSPRFSVSQVSKSSHRPRVQQPGLAACRRRHADYSQPDPNAACDRCAPNRAEREELTQLARADLYSKGQLGRDAHDRAGPGRERFRQPQESRGLRARRQDPLQNRKPRRSTTFRTTAPRPYFPQRPRQNLVTVQIDNTKEKAHLQPGPAQHSKPARAGCSRKRRAK